MATIVEKKPFVYGDFVLGGLSKIGAPTPPPGYSPYALEILREFSSSEFIGKVYQLSPSSQWNVLRPSDAGGSRWYQIALKAPNAVKFNMQGSRQWKVQNVRTETDDQGPYVAVALTSN